MFLFTSEADVFNETLPLFCKPSISLTVLVCDRLFLLPFIYPQSKQGGFFLLFTWTMFFSPQILSSDVSFPHFTFIKLQPPLQFHFPLFVPLMSLFYSTVISVNWILFFTFKFCYCD